VAEAIRGGASLKRVAEDFSASFIRYHRGLSTFRRVVAPERDFQTQFIIIVGPTRTGKSLAARTLSVTHLEDGREVPNDVYWKPPGEWWDGYDGQHTVVWDEFTGSSCSFRTLLRVLDGYPLLVPVKGDFSQFRARRVVFTSNIHPREWYNYAELGQPDWEFNPLHGRIREFGRLIFTGEAHRNAVQRLADEVAVADAEHARWIRFFENYQFNRGRQ